MSSKRAISYGPFRYAQALVVGMVVGTVVFLITFSLRSADVGVDEQLPALLLCVAGGAVLLLCSAVAGNWVIGRRVRDELELQRKLFAGGKLPPARPRPDVPGIVLEPLHAFARSNREGEAARSVSDRGMLQ